MNVKRRRYYLRSDDVLVLYDGSCGLCDGIVQFLLAHDVKNRFYFAALDSETGVIYRKRYGISADVDSVVVIYKERAMIYDDAAIALVPHLPLPYRLGQVAKIVPKPIRYAAYKLIAKNRYRFFGEVTACKLPTAAERVKFLA
ncbi:hypothetical protein A6M13_00995 [Caryophanon tenue]|uniref:Thiol-disulfide oxidoreductase n=1 Tax=Caryophanon tenue TaxID=33978 RepID=A0A1C0YMT3_9BACL|nr:hypothetical protein A6M13_00995 [Caryophanon tenue]